MSKLPLHKESRSMRAQVNGLREEQRRQRSTSPYSGTGMSPDGLGGTVTDGPLQVNGPLDVNGAATIDGPMTINGAAAITGTLSLPAGIINNDALAEPVIPGVVNVRSTGFSIPIPYTEVASVDVTIPAGCTRLLANVTAWVQGYNSKTTGGNNGSGGDYIYARVKVGSAQSGSNTPTGVSGSGGTATASMGLGVLLTGLTPGGTVHIAALGGTDYGIAADPTNEADFSGTLIWLR